MLALWNSPRQREAYEWLARELPNLRAAFRWSVDCDDLDTSATIAFYAGLLGMGSQLWRAPQLGRGTRTACDPPLITAALPNSSSLPRNASQSAASKRRSATPRWARQPLSAECYAQVPFGFEASIGTAHHLTGEPDKTAVIVRRAVARDPQIAADTFAGSAGVGADQLRRRRTSDGSCRRPARRR